MDDTARRMSDTDDVSVRNTTATDDDGDVDNRTDEMKTEIAQTRDEMAETIDAIQEKLRPATIVASAKERVKTAASEKVRALADTAENTASQVMDRTREGAGGLMDSIRENPYPAALIGFGLAWWVANASFSRRDRQWDERRWDNGATDWPDSRGRDSRYAFGGTRESSTLSNFGNRAREYADDAREYVDETTVALRRTGRRAQTQLERMLRENPLLVGAGAMMLGAAFGLAVPETDTENEWMGEARDSMVDRAQQFAGDAASKVQEAAKNVASAAGEVADSVTSRPPQQG